MTDTLSRRFRPALELLENRLTPAGNIYAAVRLGSLYISGDTRDNAVMITQDKLGTFTVSPADTSTRINGRSAPITFTRVTGSVITNLGLGNDTVQLGAAKGDTLIVNRDLQIMGSSGDKTVQALADLFVGGNVAVTTNGGSDTMDFTGAIYVHGNMNIDAGRGDNFITIAPTGGTNTIAGSLNVTNMGGVSSTSIFDTSVLHDLNLSSNGSPFINSDRTSDIFFGVSSGDVKTAVLGNANITLKQNGGSIVFADTNVAGNANISAAPSGDANSPSVSVLVGPLVNGSDVGIAGNLTVTTGSPASLTLGTVEGGAQAMLRVGGGTSLTTGNGDDQISLTGLVSTLDMRVNTQAGADLVTMDDSAVFGNLIMNLGDGADSLLLEGKEDATGVTQLVGDFRIMLGNDDDSILVGVLGDSTRMVQTYASRFFDGGAGFDTILNPRLNLVSPDGSSSDGAFANFE